MTGFTEQHIVAIDLGSSKIALIVAKVYGNDAQIIYYKDTPSAGIKNSGIMNTQLGAKAIGSLIKDAEDALDYLENCGYITCESKSAKRYKSPLALTEEGKIIGQKICEKANKVLDEVGEGLTEQERIEFYRSLTIISNNLEECSKTLK